MKDFFCRNSGPFFNVPRGTALNYSEHTPCLIFGNDYMKYPGQSITERAEMLDKTKWGLEFEWKDLVELATYLNVSRTIKGMTVFQ